MARFGYLTTTGKTKIHMTQKQTYEYYEVQCDCGTKPFFVRKERLLGMGGHSRTISCGCAVMSAGEIKISQILTENNIKYVSQYMSFDFAVFKNNKLFCLIEYDGKQHFETINYFGGEKKLIAQQRCDKKRDEYCKENNIPLIRIPYYDYDKLDWEYLNARFSEILPNIKMEN